jgi:hypothetical protein
VKLSRKSVFNSVQNFTKDGPHFQNSKPEASPMVPRILSVLIAVTFLGTDGRVGRWIDD